MGKRGTQGAVKQVKQKLYSAPAQPAQRNPDGTEMDYLDKRQPSQGAFDQFKVDRGEEQRMIQEKAMRDAKAAEQQKSADMWGGIAEGGLTALGGIAGGILGGVGGAAGGAGVGALPGAMAGAATGAGIGGGFGKMAGNLLRTNLGPNQQQMAAEDEKLRKYQLEKEREEALMGAIRMLGR